MKTRKKPTKTWNPIPVEPPVKPINNFYVIFFLFLDYVLCSKFSIKKLVADKRLGFPFLIYTCDF